MKKLTILLIALLAIISLIGCDGGSYEQGNASSERLVADDIELLGAARYYDVESFKLDIDIDFLQFYTFIHQDELHLFLREVDKDTLNTYVHLLAVDANGTNVREIYRTALDESIDFFNIIGFENHHDGHISLVTTDNLIQPPYTREDLFDGLWHFDISYTYVYRRISPNGEIVSVTEISALNNDERQITISDIAFDLNGNAVASVSWFPADFDLSAMGDAAVQGAGGMSFFLFDNGITEDFHEVEDEASSTGLFNRTHGGQIVTPSFAHIGAIDSPMFYEIDFENTAIVGGTVIGTESPIESINGVFPAPKVSVFDFYVISNGRELFGYNSADGNFSLLLDFLELGVPLNHMQIDKNEFLLWGDGRITIVNINWNASLRRDEITLFHLTPSDEPLYGAPVEPETITLGGIYITGSPLIYQATVFNRQSDTHRIEIADFSYDELDRLRTELIAGRGPDIFVLSGWGASLFAALSEGHFILDLYQMIDADPVLSREDFFPSILSTWENSRGELVQIAPTFSIDTIFGKQFAFPEAPENWNYAGFIDFYNEARIRGYDYPIGEYLDRMRILEMLVFSDDTFFCERESVASFDSESFINVLNFLKTIPADQGFNRIAHLTQDGGQWDPLAGLIRGEQLLSSFLSFSNMVFFRAWQTRLGGITAFGYPSNNAPVHFVNNEVGTAVGIRSNSSHIDAAWEFVRLGLLPGESYDGTSFPLRIDLFERLVYYHLNRTEPIKVFGEFGEVELPPMTESDAVFLRELVSNIGHKRMLHHPVQNIVNENVSDFLAGTHSAEDTARIIQSRVSIFLAERER
jgi:hypothetical protein